MVALVSLLVVLALSLLVNRVATVALRATGLSPDVARFEARSAFFGVGFTTAEAEAVVNHPLRRRIVMWLMLLGNAGVVTTIASLLLSFGGTSGYGQSAERALVLVAGLLALWALSASSWVDRRLTRLTERALRRFTDLDVRDYASLLNVSGDYAVVELGVDPDDWLAGRALKELHLPDEGVVVLGVYRADGDYVGAPTGATELRPGDVVVLYGRTAALAELDHRRAGTAGDRAHEQAAAEQRRVVRREADGKHHRRPGRAGNGPGPAAAPAADGR